MNQEPEFIENDAVGEQTLEAISDADKFNDWMYATIKPFTKGKVLEIGSGIGNISNCFIEDGISIMTSDIRDGYCKRLKERFSGKPAFLGTVNMNLTDTDFEQKFSEHLNQYDTVFALNVVEHIYDDNLAIRNAKKLLKKGGHLIILVPSYNKLMNGFDEELGHFRRYTVPSLTRLFEQEKLEVIHQQYFNFVGMFGWYISGNLLKNKVIPKGQMSLYNNLVPVIKLIDKLVLNKVGLSTIVVGRKK